MKLLSSYSSVTVKKLCPFILGRSPRKTTCDQGLPAKAESKITCTPLAIATSVSKLSANADTPIPDTWS